MPDKAMPSAPTRIGAKTVPLSVTSFRSAAGSLKLRSWPSGISVPSITTTGCWAIIDHPQPALRLQPAEMEAPLTFNAAPSTAGVVPPLGKLSAALTCGSHCAPTAGCPGGKASATMSKPAAKSIVVPPTVIEGPTRSPIVSTWEPSLRGST